MCHLEKQLARDGLVLQLYRRNLDDTFVRIPNTDAATEFLTSLIGLHPSLIRLRWNFLRTLRSLSSALRLSRTELRLRLKSEKGNKHCFTLAF